MVSNVLNVIFWGGEGGDILRMPFCIDDHVIEVPSESEQKEPAEVDTLPSQLQSPPNLSAKLNVDHVCKLWK